MQNIEEMNLNASGSSLFSILNPANYQTDEDLTPSIEKAVNKIVRTLNSRNPEDSRVAVVGPSGSGKSFIIERVIENYDDLSSDRVRTKKTFFGIFGGNGLALNELNVKNLLYSELDNHEISDLEEVCIVTDSIQAMFCLLSLDVSILFHCSSSDWVKIENSDRYDSMRRFTLIDILDLSSDFEEKVNSIERFTLDGMNDYYPFSDFKRSHIEDTLVRLVEIYSEMVDNEEEDEEGYDYVREIPIGIAALCFMRICSVYALESTDDSSIKFSDVLNEYSDMIEDLLSSTGVGGISDSDDFLNQILQGVVGGGGSIMIGTAMEEGSSGAFGPDGKLSHSFEAPVSFTDPDIFKKRLENKIYSQDSALETICDGLLIPAAGLNETNKPLRSMLFLGPTGVGKTETALTIASSLYDKPMDVLRLDMSEYSSQHQVARLFGAPPGYAGPNTGILTESVISNPHTLIIFDEAEKAHPEVWNSILQILDAGRMTDGRGMVADFTKSVVVITSNLGSKELSKNSVGFSPISSSGRLKTDEINVVMNAVREFFTPEFIGRLDDIVVFNRLEKSSIEKVVEKEVDLLRDKLRVNGTVLDKPSDDIFRSIASRIENPQYGAREVKNLVATSLAKPIAKMILNEKDSIRIRINPKKDGTFSITSRKDPKCKISKN